MSNSERVVLVLGGAGTVGSGIVKGLLDKGKWTLGHISRESTHDGFSPLFNSTCYNFLT